MASQQGWEYYRQPDLSRTRTAQKSGYTAPGKVGSDPAPRQALMPSMAPSSKSSAEPQRGSGANSAGAGSSNANANAGSSGSGGEVPQPTVMNRNNPAFLNKLRSMVDDPNTDELIRWSPSGDTFIVPNHVRFGDEVLPRFFKHNNFSSFVRQLNMYGFHKVPHLQQGALKHDQPSQNELWEFSNPWFHRDQPELLSKVQRKRSGKEREHQHTGSNGAEEILRSLPGTTSNALTQADYSAQLSHIPGLSSSAVGPVQIANLLGAIQTIKNNQRALTDEISQLQRSSQGLWQQAMENRQQTRRQQDTINRILRFMASVFGTSNMGDILNQGNSIASPAHAQSGSGHYAGRSSPMPRDATGQRPQKRARLLIGDSSHASSSSAVGSADSNNNGTQGRFQDVNASDNENSPTNSWSGIRETFSPESPSRSRSGHPSPASVRSAQSDDAPQRGSQALFGGVQPEQGESHFPGSPNASGAQLDPQLLQALQSAIASGSASGGSNSGNPGYAGGNAQQPLPGWQGTYANSRPEDMLKSQALIPAQDSPRGSMVRSASPGGAFSPDQAFARSVQRVNRDAQANAESANELQNNILSLVQNMRLDPNMLQMYLNNNEAGSGQVQDPNLQALLDMAKNSGETNTPATSAPALSTAFSPSSYVSMPQGASPSTPSFGAPADAGAQGYSAAPGQSEFDLDSFLNQFVDPISGGTQTQGANGTPSPQDAAETPLKNEPSSVDKQGASS